MKVFITGGSGFIGKAVLKNLLSQKHTVTAFLLPKEPSELVPGTSVARGDLTDPESIQGILDGHDAVIHLAGLVGFQSWKDCILINQQGTRNIVEETKKAGVKRFIHMSSVSVYGRVPDVEIDEDFPYKKIRDPYGDTKIEGEKLVRKLMEDGDTHVTIIRPTAVYGPGDKKFLPKLVENLRSGKFKMIGSGEHSVDLVHVQDVADFVVHLLENERSYGRVYNIANPDNPSWNEFLKMATTELDIPVPEGHLPYHLAFLAAYVMEVISKISSKSPRLSRYAVRLVGRQYHYNIHRMKEELGFIPSVKLLEGMRDCIREYKAKDPSNI